MDFVGHSDFVATGDEFLGHFVSLAGLTPDQRVLDVGCGIGRMARPLSAFLTPPGSYDGFDINADGIAFCQERYARFPHFRFTHVDLHNARYHPQGARQASEFTFPYDDQAFDLAIATSVLTHLVTAESERYLHEIARVLVPGGRALITFFVLDSGSRAAVHQGTTTLPFDIDAAPDAPMAVVDHDVPEEAVAFDHDWLERTFAACGLRRIEAHPGSWRGRPGRSYQDLLVLERTP